MKQKNEIILLVVLLLIGGVIWSYNRKPQAAGTTVAASSVHYPALAVDNPQLHWWKLEAARKTEYRSNGRNPFSTIAPPSPEEQRKIRQAQAIQQHPVSPSSPTVSPIPLKFFGYGSLPINGAKRAFFTDGDDVFIVGEGETLLGRFRILRIGNDSLEYEEISNGLRGRANMEEQGPSA